MKRLPMLAVSLPMAGGLNPMVWEVRASNSERALARPTTVGQCFGCCNFDGIQLVFHCGSVYLYLPT